jgi:hypothetical protein
MPIVDADIHAQLPGIHALLPYLAEYWQETVLDMAPPTVVASSEARIAWFDIPSRVTYPPGLPTSAVSEKAPRAGETVKGMLEAMREHVLTAWNVEYAIVRCAYFVDQYHNGYLAAALAAALNDWLVSELLEVEPRLRGSMLVASTNVESAVAEIERVGNRREIVEVLLPVRSALPYGHRNYHPIFQAAERLQLPIGLHFGGWPGNPPTAVGWPSYYIEEYAGRAQVFQAQLLSIIAEGIFDRFPGTRIALVEGGFSWLPPLLWRFDKDWRGLRREVPWLKRPPSEYVKEHVKLTSQPDDGPGDPTFLGRLMDQLGSDELFMFASDFPHWHFDRPSEAIPAGLDEVTLVKFMAKNSREFYRIEPSR